jgi:hypothetical protein
MLPGSERRTSLFRSLILFFTAVEKPILPTVYVLARTIMYASVVVQSKVNEMQL